MRISYHDKDFNVASWEEFDAAKREEEAQLDAMVREEEARDPQKAKSRAFRAQIKAVGLSRSDQSFPRLTLRSSAMLSLKNVASWPTTGSHI